MAQVKLVAAVIVRNEAARYLKPCVASLLEYVDEVRILDDGSTDGWVGSLMGAWGKDGQRVIVKAGSTRDDGSVAFNHHAAARNQLLQWALDGWPDWVLAIDADEVVADGAVLRKACELPGVTAWSLTIEEAWELCADQICVREDGGWRSHEIAVLWRPDFARKASYLIADNGHATGRIPAGVGARAQPTGTQLIHLGWANRGERAERFRRYQQGDGGRFHAADHIASIVWPDNQVACRSREWPSALLPYRREILKRAGVIVEA